ncbi:hypothetical protein OIO90_006317 [Microbotryomycetes sp. JL221]|nr:hypothetical protein OIO90_006317 [Microbotryomycetes sp. JL221]
MAASRDLDLPTPPATPPLPVADQSSVPTGAQLQPPGLAQQLRLATAHAHSEVMLPRVVHQLVKGQLPQGTYLRYLMMLHSVYEQLDAALDRHPTHQHLSLVYDGEMLARATQLDDDCAWFASTRQWRTQHPVAMELKHATPPVLVEYLQRIRHLARVADQDDTDSETPNDATLLLAHAYVRYLGDLSGGQTIAKSLRKAYHLPESGEGSAFYEFFVPSRDGERVSGLPRRATAHELKQVKARFREGLDKAGQSMTPEVRQRVIDEALYAFKLNMRIFQSFEERSVNDNDTGEPQAQSRSARAQEADSLQSLSQKLPVSALSALALTSAVVIALFAIICMWLSSRRKI